MAKNINLYQDNSVKTWNEIKRNLEIWGGLHLSFWGRISTIKMNVLLKMIFSLQTIPVLGRMRCFKDWQRDISKFTWQGKRPRIKHELLIDVKGRGVFSLPDHKLYHNAACLSWIREWVVLQNTDLLDIEGFDSHYGWHTYLAYDKVKVHKGFLNHMIRKPLYKVWTKYKAKPLGSFPL